MKKPRKLTLVASISAFVVFFLFVISTKIAFPALAFSGTGLGTSGSPFQITSCTQFLEIQDSLSSHYIVMNDMDCTGVTWNSIGIFSGNLDGNNKTISNITVNNTDENRGVFSVLYGATITNLTISNVTVTGTANRAGGLAGLIDAPGATLSGVSVTGSVSGGLQIGGLIGYIYASTATITNCSTNVTVSGGELIGGLVGETLSSITGSHASGSVTGTAGYIGGLVGLEREDAIISNSYAEGAVSGVDWIGGLVGRTNATVTGSHATGNVTSTGNIGGGLIGYTEYAVSDSYATGNISNSNASAAQDWGFGGLIGYSGSTVNNCYATGTVNAYRNVGGLIGRSNGAVSNSYATGAVGNVITEGYLVGGLIGYTVNTVSNSYAMGAVSGTGTVGGLIGYSSSASSISYSYSSGAVSATYAPGGLIGAVDSGSVSSSYYDETISGQSDTGRGIPKTTAEMKTQATFTSWDFGNIWDIGASYPFLLDQSIPSDNATVSSTSYTVSVGGTVSETITNVVYATSKATFLAAINKVNNDQTWNTTGVSDPVITSDTLVVTAEDGVTIVTYTITVNAEQNHIDTITSATYTVSVGGTANETIVGVSTGTDKATFLAALTKGDVTQTWNDSDIQDPVAFGDTLVVTAEDGVNITTYTVSPPPFSGAGSGTSIAPYEITTCSQIQEVQYYLLSEFIVKNDIDCAETSTWNGGVGFMPLGVDPGTPFNGVFDGNDKTISNVVINKPFASGGAFIGFFGDIENGQVKDLTLANITVTAEHYQFVGGLVGAIMNNGSTGTIDNVHVSGSVIGSDNVGGLLGIAYSKVAIVKNSSADVDAESGGYTGGLVGMGMLGIENSSASGDVVGVDAGGLVGYTQGSTSSIINSYASGAVQGSLTAGGLIGKNTMKIDNCYAEGTVTGTGDDYIGGLIGMAYASNSGDLPATINNSYATGDVSGTTVIAVGGLVGWCNAEVTNSHATGHITSFGNIDESGGMTSVGGLLALTFNGVSNSYATGNVEGDVPHVGGLIGIHYGSNGGVVTGSYATGNVTGSSNFLTGIGGLVGNAFGKVDNSYSSGSVTFTGAGDIGSAGVGGLSGLAYGIVYNCHSSSNVSSTTYNVGGLVGRVFEGITDSYATGNVSSLGNQIGGLAGWSNGPIERTYATGDVSSTGDDVGGLVGTNVGTYIRQSYALGDVSGGDYTGGLIGLSFGSITDLYAFGNVTGQSGVGGLVGGGAGNINNSYSKGLVSGVVTGGLVGKENSEGSFTVTSSYYNSQTSGQSDTGEGTPITTAQMAQQSTYVGWNFYNLWTLGMALETSSSPSGGGTTSATGQNLGNPIFKTQTGEATVTATPASGFNFLYWTENGTVVSTNLVYTMNYQSDGGYSGEANLIEISTCQQLQDIYLNMSGLYTLTGDIDCTESSTWNSGAGFIPLGEETGTSVPFTGLLEGANYTIRNLTINIAGSDSNIGIFGSIDGGGVIKNLNIENITVNVPASSYVGALVSSTTAAMGSAPSVSNVHVTSGNISGDQYVGGLIGSNESSIIESSSSAANVNGSYSVGGLIGYQMSGDVTGSSATGIITGSDAYNGGFVGQASSGTIDSSFATGDVSGTGYSGGFAGSAGAVISNSYATGDVSGTGLMVGGLVGYSNASIISSYTEGDVIGIDLVGGLVGYAVSSISESYAIGNISGGNSVGGLVGETRDSGTLSNSYAIGNVEGTDAVGGLVGNIYGTLITNSYSNGLVTGSTNTGGLVGSYYNNGVLPVSAYYDSETSGMSDTDKGVAKTTTQMKTQATFTGWDFSTIWSIASGVNNGYPAFIVIVPEVPAPPAPPAQECMIERDFSTAHNPPCGEDEAGYDDENGVKKCAKIVSIVCTDVEGGGGGGETPVITRRLVANFAPTYIPPVDPTTVSITNLNTSMSAIDTSSSLDVTVPSETFKGIGRNIRLYFGSGITKRVIANIQTDLTISRSWANVEGLLNLSSKKVLVHNLASAPGAEGKYDLYVPKGTDDNRVLVCPNAVTLSAVTFGCTDGYILTSNEMTSSVIAGSTYWIIRDLTGTGAMSYEYIPGEPPVIPPDEPVTPDDEVVIPDDETPDNQEEVKDVEDPGEDTTIKDIVEVLSTFSRDVAKVVKELPISETASQNITAATLAVIIVSPAVSVGVGSSYAIAYIFRGFSMFLAFFGIGRKKRNCGLVYNSVTKEPLKNAIVRIYNLENTLVATEVTNMYGIFETDMESGQYSILVQANNFRFPSMLISGAQDYPYNNVYRGGNFNYDTLSNISYSIPVDPLDRSNTEYVGAIARNRFVKWTSILMNLFVLFGLVFSIISYIKLNSTLNLILLIVYVLMILVNIIIRRQEKYKFGTVVNMMEEPQQGVQIGLMEMEFNTIYAKRITNEKGRYRFIVPGGEYKLVSLDPNYEIDGNGILVDGKNKKILAISKNFNIVRRT